MALKYKLTKAEFEKLTPEMQALYAGEGDNYTLDVDGLEDTGALKRSKEYEVKRRKELQTENENLRRERDEAVERLETSGGDAKTSAELEKTIKARYEKQMSDLKASHDATLNSFKGTTARNTARELAIKLAGGNADNADLLLPHLQGRIHVDIENGQVVTHVMDEHGERSGLTLEDLSKEFFTNKKFGAIIVGSNGSGSGAPGSSRGGSGGSSTPKLEDMTATEEAQFANQFPDQYAEMLAKAGGQG